MKKTKYLTIESLRIAFYKRFPNSTIVLTKFISERFVEIIDKYGTCNYSLNHILHEGTSSILNSINKTKYFIEQAKEIHENKYDYSLVEYKNSKSNIKIICQNHGEFSITPVKHLYGQGCKKCGYEIVIKKNTLDTKSFIKKASKIHQNNYNYSLVEYKNTLSKVKILCKHHGMFEQIPNVHLNGSGCQKCKNKLTSQRNKENPTGWGYTNWEKASLKSKNFDSFKVYIIECWNEEERFYKIGKTYTSIKKRFESKVLLPYNFNILKIYEGNAKEISELELKLKNMNKNYKYIPKIIFNGMYECYNNINNYEEFLIKK